MAASFYGDVLAQLAEKLIFSIEIYGNKPVRKPSQMFLQSQTKTSVFISTRGWPTRNVLAASSIICRGFEVTQPEFGLKAKKNISAETLQ